MSGRVRDTDAERQRRFFTGSIDPVVRAVLEADNPWEAYRLAGAIADLMTDTSPGGSFDLPHAGQLYVAWAELTDLFATGKTPITEAHAVLRSASERWLGRSEGAAADESFEVWLAVTSEAVRVLVQRYGDFWSNPD